VLRLQAFKFELQPSGERLRNLRQFAGSCRFVCNKGLALNIERYEKKEKRLGYAGLCALLPNWKREHEFLSDVPAQALQQALQNLERAYTNFAAKSWSRNRESENPDGRFGVIRSNPPTRRHHFRFARHSGQAQS